MFKRPSFFIALAGIIAVTLLVLRLQRGEPPAVPLVEPPRAPYADSVGARGIVEGRGENVRVTPNVAGRVQRVFVKVGGQVRAGEPLFQLDSREAESTVGLQEAQVAVLRAKVKEAEVPLADRMDSLARTQALRKKDVASQDDSQRAYFAAEAARMQLERAKADLLLAEAQLREARVQLDLLTVRAPRDAEVLQVNIREGEYAAVNATEPPVLLGDTRVLQLRADVDEDSASRVRPGAAAVAFPKGTRSDPLPLRFVRIEPYILPKRSLTGDSTERVDTRVLQVIYEFEEHTLPVYPGQQMDVFIESGAASPTPRP